MDLSDLPIVDDHGHPFLTDPWTVPRETFLQIFTEGRPGSMTRHLVHGGYYQRALHAMAKELQTEPDLPAVLDARRRLGPASVRDMIAARRIETLLIDTGYGSDVQGLPELFALSADWGRAALGEALEWIESRGGLPGGAARAVARRILSDNARDLYRL